MIVWFNRGLSTFFVGLFVHFFYLVTSFGFFSASILISVINVHLRRWFWLLCLLLFLTLSPPATACATTVYKKSKCDICVHVLFLCILGYFFWHCILCWVFVFVFSLLLICSQKFPHTSVPCFARIFILFACLGYKFCHLHPMCRPSCFCQDMRLLSAWLCLHATSLGFWIRSQCFIAVDLITSRGQNLLVVKHLVNFRRGQNSTPTGFLLTWINVSRCRVQC